MPRDSTICITRVYTERDSSVGSSRRAHFSVPLYLTVGDDGNMPELGLSSGMIMKIVDYDPGNIKVEIGKYE